MSDVVVSLSLATICFLGQCHSALVGKHTPTGVFAMRQARITAPGYGGDVVLFARRADGIPLAIHRRWDGAPAQGRAARLLSPAATDRQGITAGCVNVDPAVYATMPKAGTLVINP